MAELTATVDQQPNQTTVRISGYLSSENAESAPIHSYVRNRTFPGMR